jgi:GNAT superfamily N-acetyltransferase
MDIRPATAADAPALARLRWALSEPSGSYEAFAAAFVSWCGPALSGAWTAVVADDGALRGNVWLQRVAGVPRPADLAAAWGYVTNTYVDDAVRGRGVGTRLLDAVIARARADRLELLVVWPSERAASLYRRAGFRVPRGADGLLELPL